MTRLTDALAFAALGLLQPLPILAACWVCAPEAVTPGGVALALALGALGAPLGVAAGARLARRFA